MVIGYSAGNFQIRDKEPTGRIVIPPGITGSCTRLFNGGRVILQGITSLWMGNSYSDGNHQFMDEKSTRGTLFLR
jgi:hypothetical protein